MAEIDIVNYLFRRVIMFVYPSLSLVASTDE